MIGWEDLLSWYLLCRRVSPTKTADWRVIYCIGFLFVYSQHITLLAFSLISLFKNCNIFFEGTIKPVCAESSIEAQSISQSIAFLLARWSNRPRSFFTECECVFSSAVVCGDSARHGGRCRTTRVVAMSGDRKSGSGRVLEQGVQPGTLSLSRRFGIVWRKVCDNLLQNVMSKLVCCW